MSEILFQILNGLTLGGIYALIALGYTMVYGIIKLINFAHGEVFMLGAFVSILLSSYISQNFFIVLMLSMLICSIIGVIVERVAYRPLRDGTPRNKAFTAIFLYLVLMAVYYFKNQSSFRIFFSSKVFILGIFILLLFLVLIYKKQSKSVSSSRINALISAIGMSILLSNMVTVIYGPQRAVFPNLLNLNNIKIMEQVLPVLNFFIILSSLVLMGILYLIVHKTKIGLAMRAVSQNSDAAKLMGINPNRIISYTFAIGSALASAAGVLVGTHYGIAEATMGSLYGLKAFVAAVLGGIGSIPGAMVGGFVLGLAEIFGVAATPFIVKIAGMAGIEFITPSFRDAIAFGLLIVILIIKPTGIFGKNIREKV